MVIRRPAPITEDAPGPAEIFAYFCPVWAVHKVHTKMRGVGGLKPAYGLRTGVGGMTAAYILYESGVGLDESVSEDEGEPVVIARGKNIPFTGTFST